MFLRHVDGGPSSLALRHLQELMQERASVSGWVPAASLRRGHLLAGDPIVRLRHDGDTVHATAHNGVHEWSMSFARLAFVEIGA